jgi:DHA2 family multidrug resistance protein
VVAPAVGPTLGGWLTDNYAWPWIFYINVPIGVLNLMLVSRFVHDPPYLVRDKGSIDYLGLGLMTMSLGSLQYLLEKGETEGWLDSRLIVTLAYVAAFGMAGFIWRELSTARPAVNLRLLRQQTFTSATVLGGILGMALNGSLFLLPVFLQQYLGYPAIDSGLALMPRSLAMIVLMPIGGLLYNRLGPRILVGTGLVISAYSFWLLGRLSPNVGFWNIFFPQLWQGIGFSLIFVALSTAALGGVARTQVTAASGLYNVIRQVSGSVGIAIAATMVSRGTVRYRSYLSENLSIGNLKTQLWLHRAEAVLIGHNSEPVVAAHQALKMLNLYLVHQASLVAYNHVYQLIALSFIVCLPLVLLLRRPTGHVEVEVAAE